MEIKSKKQFSTLLLLSLGIFFFSSCSSDDQNLPIPKIIEPDPINGEEQEEIYEKAGEVFHLLPGEVDDSYLLVNDADSNKVYIMDKDANILHEWSLSSGLGNDCTLEENGQLLALLESSNPEIQFGGFGGKIQLINPDNSISWEYIVSDETMISHHDAERLPNGNILIMVWTRKTSLEATAAGFDSAHDIYPESLIEVNPVTNNIDWEWHSWDHIIQNVDKEKSNYGEISEHPNKIDINYNSNENGDIMHANGLSYDDKNDLIYLSVNFYSEVWVIDHSTTIEESKNDTGGNYNKGGDLIYRFGNPTAYQNPNGARLFFNNHFPNLSVNLDNNTMLLFMNGNNVLQSTVYEFKFPETLSLEKGIDNEPEVIWSFTDPELFSPKVSGATKLPNGNILITEGDYGAWEVNQNGDIVWKFSGSGFFWRIYPIDKNSAALNPFNL